MRDPTPSYEADVVLPVRARLGESPVWCSRSERLFWVDIDGRSVHRTDPINGTDEVRFLSVRPGSIALCREPGRLLIAAEHSLYDFEWSSGALSLTTRLEVEGSPTRMNDGRCDTRGRFWVGSMDDPAGTGARAAQLHCIDVDLTARVVEVGVGVSNALAFDADGTTMYWADTSEATIWAFDYDPETGRRSRRRELVRFGGDLAGLPDGACVDEAGCLWVACVYGWSVVRFTPTGEVDRVVRLPVEKPSMPAFGGRDLDTLFVTSISTGGARPAAPDQPLAGALLSIDVGGRGVPEPVFAG